MTKGFSTPSQSTHRPAKPSGSKAAVNAEQVQQQWVSQFQELEDPRGLQGQEHAFVSILLIAILAAIGGATGWDDIELYAVSHQPWLGTFLDLRNGVPHADTYRRVFERVNPEALQCCFLGWVALVVEQTGAQVIPIDGKCVKGSYDRNKKQSALHVVSAWASSHRLMLGQVKVENKTNEIKAIPALLELLEITGCIITIDAMGTQTEIARQIIAKGADYILSLKANHPTLCAQVKAWFEAAQLRGFEGIEHTHDHRVEAGHHRREIRQIWAVRVAQMGGLYEQHQWLGLQTVVMVVRIRHLWNKTTREVQFYLSSLPSDALRIGRAIRQHWGIENQLHWVLDVSFGEDASRIRNGHSPENFTLLRRMAISLLNQETSTKRSLRQKAKRAAMDCNYMLQVLSAALPQ
ncbi:ISAs1 family transposase [Patescibacteria group bacterium]|jgi:predicted transposase YbfD/YdcC|nr:ISAs1 family transposase [Patescibacteria group bacterium]